jgi:hypothetical protein
MRGIVLPILALCVLTAAERPRLVGLKRVAVAVTADPTGGLDTRHLQTAVESRLKEAGLRVDPKSRARLNVTIGVSDIRAGNGEGLGYAYSIHLGVSQQVYLANSPNVLTDAVTWEGVWLGIASRGDLNNKCAQSIAKRLDEFVEVYQAGLAEEEQTTSRASVRR